MSKKPLLPTIQQPTPTKTYVNPATTTAQNLVGTTGKSLADIISSSGGAQTIGNLIAEATNKGTSSSAPSNGATGTPSGILTPGGGQIQGGNQAPAIGTWENPHIAGPNGVQTPNTTDIVQWNDINGNPIKGTAAQYVEYVKMARSGGVGGFTGGVAQTIGENLTNNGTKESNLMTRSAGEVVDAGGENTDIKGAKDTKDALTPSESNLVVTNPDGSVTTTTPGGEISKAGVNQFVGGILGDLKKKYPNLSYDGKTGIIKGFGLKPGADKSAIVEELNKFSDGSVKFVIGGAGNIKAVAINRDATSNTVPAPGSEGKPNAQSVQDGINALDQAMNDESKKQVDITSAQTLENLRDSNSGIGSAIFNANEWLKKLGALANSGDIDNITAYAKAEADNWEKAQIADAKDIFLSVSRSLNANLNATGQGGTSQMPDFLNAGAARNFMRTVGEIQAKSAAVANEQIKTLSEARNNNISTLIGAGHSIINDLKDVTPKLSTFPDAKATLISTYDSPEKVRNYILGLLDNMTKNRGIDAEIAKAAIQGNKDLQALVQNMGMDWGSIIGSFIGAAGTVGAAGITACWVARELFGSWEHPNTIAARHFILNIGPVWFKDLYIKHGERFAEFISDKPLVKAIIKPLFELFALGGRLKWVS